jgi:hypothetical protein
MSGPMFQLVSNNASLFREPSIELSTVGWKLLDRTLYESCLFTKDSHSEVVAQYNSMSEAIAGHHRLSNEYNLNNRTEV